MDSNGKVALVLSYQYPGKYAFTVLAGAVESDGALADVPMHFPRDRESLLATVRQCADEGYTVVAAWSFYSASFGAAVEELACGAWRGWRRGGWCRTGGARGWWTWTRSRRSRRGMRSSAPSRSPGAASTRAGSARRRS